MLTFILVVVLGGGVGLLVVSLAESEKPATDAGPDRRADDGDDDHVRGSGEVPGPAHDEVEPPAHHEVEPPAPGPVGPGAHPPVAVAPPEPEPEPEPQRDETEPFAPEPEPVFAPLQPRPVDTLPRRRSAGSVPSAFVAVEGTYADVATAPLWRRFLAVIGITLIAVLAGVVVAGVLAAAIGAAAEVLDNTIG